MSATHRLLNVPFTKSTVISNRAFGVAGTAPWNGLPRDIRALTTLTVFKSRLRGFAKLKKIQKNLDKAHPTHPPPSKLFLKPITHMNRTLKS